MLGAEKINPKQSDAIVEQLSRINEQLIIKNRRAKRIWKTVIIMALVLVVVIPEAECFLFCILDKCGIPQKSKSSA